MHHLPRSWFSCNVLKISSITFITKRWIEFYNKRILPLLYLHIESVRFTNQLGVNMTCTIQHVKTYHLFKVGKFVNRL